MPVKIKDFYKKYKGEIWLVVFAVYVILLGVATVSEIFELGWIGWL